MAQVLVREVEPEVINKLKKRAKNNGRSLEAELRLILDKAASEPEGDFDEALQRVRSMFAGQTFSDSTELIREDRER